MAFNKDKSGPAYAVTKMSLIQQMKRASARPQRQAGGGGMFYRDRFQPTTKGKADIIRLIPGSYPTPKIDENAKDYAYNPDGSIVNINFPFYTYVSYFHGPKMRGCNGSEGPLGKFRGKGEPCIAADWFWYEWRTRNRNNSKRPNSMQRSDKFAFTVLVQAPFYKVPQVDKDGSTKRNPKTDEPYYEWVRGSTRRNDEYAAAGYECKDGHLMHWSLNFTQWMVLQEYQNEVARHCVSCGTQNSIEELALTCKHCGNPVVEFGATNLDDEEIAALRSEEVRCPACGAGDYLDVVSRCTECEHGEPATLFDVDLRVKRVDTGNSNKGGGAQTVLTIVGCLGPRPILDMYGEELRKPLPLDKIFAPTPLDKQEDLFGIPPDDGEDAKPRRSQRDEDDDEDEDTDEEEERPRKKKKKISSDRQPVNRTRPYRG